MIKKRRAPSRAMALILTLAMILSMLVIPTAAKEPEVTTPDPETLEEIVGIMKEYIDGESAFDKSILCLYGLADHRRPLAELRD